MSLERIDDPLNVKDQKDHLYRYRLAVELAKKINAKSIVDCAAGIGYGSD